MCVSQFKVCCCFLCVCLRCATGVSCQAPRWLLPSLVVQWSPRVVLPPGALRHAAYHFVRELSVEVPLLSTHVWKFDWVSIPWPNSSRGYCCSRAGVETKIHTVSTFFLKSFFHTEGKDNANINNFWHPFRCPQESVEKKLVKRAVTKHLTVGLWPELRGARQQEHEAGQLKWPAGRSLMNVDLCIWCFNPLSFNMAFGRSPLCPWWMSHKLRCHPIDTPFHLPWFTQEQTSCFWSILVLQFLACAILRSSFSDVIVTILKWYSVPL